MISRDEKAVEYSGQGFNCAQSVLASCSDLTGLDEKASLAVAGGFGGGLHRGELCGALAGAVMALGAAFPHNEPGDTMAKTRIGGKSEECCRRFEEEFGCLRCRDLLEAAGGRGRCPEFMGYCAELVAEMIEDD
jgi:C_GCAxxG_C_C family probable redox protein